MNLGFKLDKENLRSSINLFEDLSNYLDNSEFEYLSIKSEDFIIINNSLSYLTKLSEDIKKKYIKITVIISNNFTKYQSVEYSDMIDDLNMVFSSDYLSLKGIGEISRITNIIDYNRIIDNCFDPKYCSGLTVGYDLGLFSKNKELESKVLNILTMLTV